MNPAQLPMVRPPHFIPIPPNQISITMSDIIPKESLYINNLNTKIKCEELKISLYFLFCPFGEILNIICYNKPNLRGQAFIIFKSTSHATLALKTLQNFSFFDKPLKINYTKERSDFFSKSDGTFVQREKKKLETNISTDLVKKKVKTEEKHEAKKINNTNGNEENSLINNPPNNVLFVEHVPTFATQEMMIELFKQYPGFKLISQKHIAFVEYEDQNQASVALSGLDGFKITQKDIISVKYAKV